jgi:predicted DNA-binding transcriptional regulator YafY
MGDHQAFERYYWFDKQIKAGKYPNATALANEFECDKKTANRAIMFMQDRLHAPLEYDMTRHGYIYTDDTYELPSMHVTQEELLAILLARNILASSAGGVISERINQFGKRLFAKMGDMGLDEQRLQETFSASWNEFVPTDGRVFQAVSKAMLEGRILNFSYTSPREQEPTERIVEPHHLQHYMGAWTMIGYCRLRGGWRRFMLSRMSGLALTKETFKPRPQSEWANQVTGGFGIFQGGELKWLKLRFNQFRAAWLREQVWHPQQTRIDHPDGSLDLSFPVCEFHEVKMKILQFGGDVEVLEPVELRDEVRGEIEKMKTVYR